MFLYLTTNICIPIFIGVNTDRKQVTGKFRAYVIYFNVSYIVIFNTSIYLFCTQIKVYEDSEYIVLTVLEFVSGNS